MSRAPLLNPNQPSIVRLLWWLFLHRELSIIVGFFPPGNNSYQADAGLDGVYPKRPAPGKLGEHEGGEEGAQVGRKNYEGLPDVDLTSVLDVSGASTNGVSRRTNLRMFMKEEHVFDEHETALDQFNQ